MPELRPPPPKIWAGETRQRPTALQAAVVRWWKPERPGHGQATAFIRIDIVEALAEMLRSAPLDKPDPGYVKDYCKALTAYHEVIGKGK